MHRLTLAATLPSGFLFTCNGIPANLIHVEPDSTALLCQSTVLLQLPTTDPKGDGPGGNRTRVHQADRNTVYNLMPPFGKATYPV